MLGLELLTSVLLCALGMILALLFVFLLLGLFAYGSLLSAPTVALVFSARCVLRLTVQKTTSISSMVGIAACTASFNALQVLLLMTGWFPLFCHEFEAVTSFLLPQSICVCRLSFES